MARRKSNIKKLKKQIFIIGEGITEQIYFNQLKQFENIKIKIKPELPYTTDITGIVKKAKKISDASPANIVYCIIDLDRILSNTAEAKKYKKLKPENKKIKFFEINPCFELWFLLHNKYKGKEYNNCNEVIKFLKKYIPDYEKTEKYFLKKNLYVLLKDKLSIAVSNSKKLNNSGSKTKCDIYKIIEELNIV